MVTVKRGTVQRAVLKAKPTDESVLDLARDRIARCFDLYDTVVVQFSGGKDSTVVLNLTVEVARALGRLPIHVVFWDEEAIPLPTHDLLMRTSHRTDEIALRWMAPPMLYHNSCSTEEPVWYPWGPEYEALWVRPLPDTPTLVTSIPGYATDPKEGRRWHMLLSPLLYDTRTYGSVVNLLGIRAEESLSRRQVLLRTFAENWIKEEITPENVLPGHVTIKAYPIYDWRTDDVWRAIGTFGWDYNEAYDRMAMIGIPPRSQRISSPFHVEALTNLTTWAACYPETFDRLTQRVPGAQTAIRYGVSELFGRGAKDKTIAQKPPMVSWREWVIEAIKQHPPDRQRYLADRLAYELRRHFSRTDDPIVEKAPHPESGLSWSALFSLALRDDWMMRKRWQVYHPDRPEYAKAAAIYDAELAALTEAGRLGDLRP